jgi:DNA processing protein
VPDDTTVLAPGDARRPGVLADLEPASTLWWRGSLAPVEHLSAVAIVGTRHPTPYGQRAARKLAEGCARAGLTVVSGLAMGVDAAAHLGALDAPDGMTIAVMANGVDIVHPRANAALADRVLGSGALVSAYPPGDPPYKNRFLERNQLIAALCKAVIVVEGAHPTSGALSTAARAHELGRELLAVPGMINVPQAGGPNALIRDGIAPCLDVEDILFAVTQFRPGRRNEPLERRARLDPGELTASDAGRRLLIALDEGALDPVTLAGMAELAPAQAALELLDLELAGLVRRTVLGGYERLG